MHNTLFSIKIFTEYELSVTQHAEIARIRACAFPGFGDERSYFKQIPHVRVVALDNVGNIIGQIGIDHRIIRIGEESFDCFGLTDVCVIPDYRGRGIGSAMILCALNLARTHGIALVLLFASDDRIYVKHGFVMLTRLCTWMRVNEFYTLGITSEMVDDLMILSLAGDTIPAGDLDFLGYMF